MTTATTATATKDTYKPTYWAYIMLPLMGVIFGVFSYYTRGGVISKTFPYFHSFVVLFVMITMERIWMYRKAVSQKHMIWRDLTSTMVQTFLVGGVFGAIVLPILHFFPNTFVGRRRDIRRALRRLARLVEGPQPLSAPASASLPCPGGSPAPGAHRTL